MISVLARPASRRPPRVAPFSLATLPGLWARWPTLGTGTPGAYVANPSPAPGTFHGSPTWVAGDFPAALAGQVTGCLDFGTGTAAGVTVSWVMGASNSGIGKQAFGPQFTLGGWVKFSAFPAGNYGGLALLSGANGFHCQKIGGDYRLGWYPYTTPTGSDLQPDGVWRFVWLRLTAGQLMDWGVGATRSASRANLPGGTILTLGGLTGTSNGFGRFCRWFFHNDWLTDADIALLAAGNDPAPLTKLKTILRLDDGTGTTAADTSVVLTGGSAVASIPDSLGHATRHLTQATPANQGVYVVGNPPPVNMIPLYGGPIGGAATDAGGLEGSVRLDDASDHYDTTEALGTVTAFSCTFLGRAWAMPTQGGQLNILAKLFSASGAPGSGGHSLVLGVRTGTYYLAAAGTMQTWRWVAEVNGGGGVVSAKEELPGAEPCTIGMRYRGGAAAGSRRVEFWRNGVKRGEVTGASVPASLTLDAGVRLGDSANPCGWQARDAVVGTAFWSAVQMAQTHQALVAGPPATTIPDVVRRTAVDGGGFYSSSPFGYNQLNSSIRDPVSGRIHLFFNAGYTDPSPWPQFYLYSDDTGASWSARRMLKDASVRSWFTFNNSCVVLQTGPHAGRLVCLGSYSDPGSTVYVIGNNGSMLWYTDNPNASTPAFNPSAGGEPILIAEPGGPNSSDFSWPQGRVYELIPGSAGPPGVEPVLRTAFYGKKTGAAEGTYTVWIRDSFDGGFTWMNVVCFQTVLGLADGYYVEPYLLHLGGSEWVMAMRGGAPPMFTWSSDNCLTWTAPLRLGTSAMPTNVMPAIHRCQDGSLLFFHGRRLPGNPPYDPGMRIGTGVARSRDNGRTWTWGPTPVNVGLTGLCYPSVFDGGLDADGDPTVMLVEADDRVNLVFIHAKESLWL